MSPALAGGFLTIVPPGKSPETPLLKGTQNLMLWGPGQKQYYERSLGQTHLLILASLLERQEATGAHLGDIDTGAAILTGSFYLEDFGVGKYEF